MSILHHADHADYAISKRAHDEEGQTLGEYGVLLGFIAVIVVAAAIVLGTSISDLFNQIIAAF
jgi:pilus assembly protein Flp/PilA